MSRVNLHNIISGCLMISMLWSCKQKSNDVSDKHEPIDSLGGVMPDIPLKDIDNAYTDIMNKMCNHQEFSDLKYNTHNTDFYSLNAKDTAALFLAVSEIDCGYTPGSCGRNIEIIRKDKNKYESIFKSCGKITFIDTTNSQYPITLRYVTKSEKEISVVYDGVRVQSQTVSYFGMPIEDLEVMSDRENIILNNIIKKGKKTDNLDAIMVIFESHKLDEAHSVNYYSYKSDSSQVNYIFIKNRNKILSEMRLTGDIDWSADYKTFTIRDNAKNGQNYTYQSNKKKFVKNVNL